MPFKHQGDVIIANYFKPPATRVKLYRPQTVLFSMSLCVLDAMPPMMVPPPGENMHRKNLFVPTREKWLDQALEWLIFPKSVDYQTFTPPLIED